MSLLPGYRETLRRVSARQITILWLLAMVWVTGGFAAFGTTTSLVAPGTVWRYLDNGSNQGTAWRMPGFTDSGWASGPAQFGYGDGDEATVVGYGSSSDKYITTYFRREFPCSNPSLFTALVVRLLRDDGAVVYLNGTEIVRSNLPAGVVDYQTTAPSAVEDNTFHQFQADPALLVAGTNVLAAEIHQASPTSSDISFDLELYSSDAAALVRDPYLQLVTSTSVIVRWRTDVACVGRVNFGTTSSTLLSAAVESTPVTEHQVTLSSLLPKTQYFYNVGYGSTVLSQGVDHHFETWPAPGSTDPFRVWALGDSGRGNADQAAVRDSFVSYAAARGPQFWIMLGDNAYSSGLDAEYQSGLFAMYPAHLKSLSLLPTLGNHDAVSANALTQTGPYFDNFTLPKNGILGGTPSQTEAYWSFDFGRVHFICLDSDTSDRTPPGPMLSWLQDDLSDSAGREWLVAYWHHPPYTKGSHDSDNAGDSGGRMRDMRQFALPILEAAGADLILTGHSHSYERSCLLNGHYGVSTTLTPAMKLDAGDGKPGGNGAYTKPAYTGTHNGTVYAVAGSSAAASGGPLNHPAMITSQNVLGSMVLDFDRNRLDAVFVDSVGLPQDTFTIIKDTNTNPLVEQITRLDASPTSGPLVRYHVRFTHAVQGVDAADFHLTTTGLSGSQIFSVSGSGSVYEVQAQTGTGNGTLRLDIDDNDSINNSAGKNLGGPGSGNGNFTGASYTVTNSPVAVGLSQVSVN